MRIVVVGASGNTGTALLRRLADEPGVDRVVGVSRRVPPDQPPYDAAEWVTCDIGGDSAVDELTAAFAGADAVVHLAWQIQPSQQPKVLHRTNVLGSRHVCEAVLRTGVPSLVVASSVGTSPATARPTDQREVRPRDGVDDLPGRCNRHKAPGRPSSRRR